MGTIEAREAQQQTAMAAASLMAAAARKAPKTRGLNALQSVILDGADSEVLASAMETKGRTKRTKLTIFPRDAQNVRASAAVLLLGVTGEPKRPELPIDCGACGCGTCKEFVETSKDEGQDFRGPLCIYPTLDLGIALGVAAKVAGDLCVDSRIMYSVGAAARQAGYLKGCDVVLGCPSRFPARARTSTGPNKTPECPSPAGWSPREVAHRRERIRRSPPDGCL